MSALEVTILVVFFATVFWLSHILNKPTDEFFPPPEPNNMLRSEDE